MLSFEYQNKFKIITFYKDEMFHIILHQKEQLYDLQNYMICIFYSVNSAWKVQIIRILHHVKVSQAL